MACPTLRMRGAGYAFCVFRALNWGIYAREDLPGRRPGRSRAGWRQVSCNCVTCPPWIVTVACGEPSRCQTVYSPARTLGNTAV
jgi:hypothetical protein